jgi:TPR repeat protein
MDFAPAMVNLGYLIFKCAKNNIKLNYGNKLMVDEMQNINPSNIFGDDADDAYFDAATQLKLALSHDPNLADANYLMGVLYEFGLGVSLNHEIAQEYYLKASKVGHVKANTKLGHFAYSGVRRGEFLNSAKDPVAPISG